MEYINYGQIILGPAGSGKSTYCKIIQSHGEIIHRIIKVVNLDPAAEAFNYNCDINIKELINVQDVMFKQKLCPNGALVFCMEYLLSHYNWLEEQLNSFGDNVYYLFDCPGQLELYSHYNIMKRLFKLLQKNGFSLVSVFCLDCTFLQEQSKFISGNLLSLATMMQLGLPHLTILTKCDLIYNKKIYSEIEEGITPEDLSKELTPYIGNRCQKLNELMVSFVKNYSLVDLKPLNRNDIDSINAALYQADMILQFYDSQEPKESDFFNAENKMMGINEEQE